MNEYCVYLPPWESKLLRFQYYFVGVQFHWLMLMQTISLYRSRPDPRESVQNSSSVYQDTRYQDFPSIAMSAIRSKNDPNFPIPPHPGPRLEYTEKSLSTYNKTSFLIHLGDTCINQIEFLNRLGLTSKEAYESCLFSEIHLRIPQRESTHFSCIFHAVLETVIIINVGVWNDRTNAKHKADTVYCSETTPKVTNRERLLIITCIQ